MSNQITPNPSVPSQVVQEVKFPKFVNNLGIIPTSYKDSMSYYECLAWLCKYLEETVIPTVNENGEAVEELQGLYIELNSYVTHYFDTLDVQEEINNKLDDMVEDGTLQTSLSTYFTNLENSYNERFDEQASAIQQQNNVINSLDARMDTFSQLTQGSTSGDAELQDIRIGADGYTYPTAGTSVRKQISNIQKNVGDFIYNITTKGTTGGYVEIEQEIQSGTEFYVKLNDYAGVTLTNYVIYGYNENQQYVNILQKTDQNLYYVKTTQDFSKIRLYINYTLSGQLADVYATFMFGFVNNSNLFSLVKNFLGGNFLGLNKLYNQNSTTVSNTNASTYVPDLDLNKLHDFKVYYFNGVNSLSHQPVTTMSGIFISFPYDQNSEFGCVQVYCSNVLNKIYYRTNTYAGSTGANWTSWNCLGKGLSETINPTVVNNSNASTYVPDLDLNKLHDFKTYYIYNVTTLSHQPVTTMDGLFYSICFNTMIEPGTVQFYVDKTNIIYTRSCSGANDNPQWTNWKRLYREGDTLQYNTNLKTYKIFKKVVCVGDSYTAGYINDGTVSETNEDYAWPHYLSTDSGNEYINCGSSGANTKTWQTVARGLTKAQSTGVVQAYIIGLGINDSSSNPNLHIDVGTSSDIGTDNDTYYGNLSKIIRELKTISSQAKIFLLTRPQSGTTYNSTYNEAVRDIAEAYESTYDVTLVDLYSDYNDLFTNSSLTGDALAGHYTAIGYEQFAEILAYCLSDTINKNISDFQDVYSLPYGNS